MEYEIPSRTKQSSMRSQSRPVGLKGRANQRDPTVHSTNDVSLKKGSQIDLKSYCNRGSQNQCTQWCHVTYQASHKKVSICQDKRSILTHSSLRSALLVWIARLGSWVVLFIQTSVTVCCDNWPEWPKILHSASASQKAVPHSSPFSLCRCLGEDP